MMSTLRVAQIVRRPEALPLDGFRVSSRAAVARILGELSPEGSCIVSDLSLGAWRPRQAAAEFSGQLGIPLPLLDAPDWAPRTHEESRRASNGDYIGLFVDAESRGDRTTTVALHDAGQLADAVRRGQPRTFVLMLPHDSRELGEDNVLFIHFFAQALRGSHSRLAILYAGADDPETPSTWRVRWKPDAVPAGPRTPQGVIGLFPGVLSPDLLAALSSGEQAPRDLLPLDHGWALLPPESRLLPKGTAVCDYEGLAAAAQSLPWVKAYAQCLGSDQLADSWFLFGLAWRALGEGSSRLAVRLMERALGSARTPARADYIRALLQGVRIALGRFEELTRAEDPRQTMPPRLRGFLLQAKGWGLVMCGKPADADTYLTAARSMLRPSEPVRSDYLYLLNISALSRFRLGDVAGALAMEEEIETTAARFPQPDWRLEYINSLNLARTHRRRKDVTASESYYRRAFATCEGGRTESDLVYANVCLAKVDQDQGRPASSFLRWLRAGLHWVSSTAPEAIGSRVTAGVMGCAWPCPPHPPEEVAATLAARIIASVAASGLESLAGVAGIDLAAVPSPVFVRTDQLPARSLTEAVYVSVAGADGCGVFLTSLEADPAMDGPQHRRLRALLGQLLGTLAPGELDLSLAIGIDHALGSEIPGTPHDLLAACVRLGVPRLTANHRMIECGDDLRARVESNLQVRFGGLVDRVQPEAGRAQVIFKRYLPPADLDERDSQILQFLNDQPSVAELARRLADSPPPHELCPSLRRLERARVLDLFLSAAGCVNCGVTFA